MDQAFFWQTLLYGMLCFIMAGYTLLDGFDLGTGLLLIFFPQADDRRLMLNSLAPVWDGNEVWLIIAGGLLFAAFPPVYANVLSGFYLWVMAVLGALILRATSFEFWYQDEKRRGFWGAIFSVSSLLILLLLGFLVGNAVVGVPLTADFKYSGTWSGIGRPWPWVVALAGVVIFFFQGAAYISAKTEGALQTRVLRLAKRGWWATLTAYLGLAMVLARALPQAPGRALFWIGSGLIALSLGLTARAIFSQANRPWFAKASLGIIGAWLLLAGVQFPNLLRASDPSAVGLTMVNASSPVPVLKLLAGFVACGLLVVCGTTWFVYRVFKGKVKPGEGY